MSFLHFLPIVSFICIGGLSLKAITLFLLLCREEEPRTKLFKGGKTKCVKTYW